MIPPSYAWIHAARMAAIAITNGDRVLDSLPKETKTAMLSASLEALPREFSSVQQVVSDDAYAAMHIAACEAGIASLAAVNAARRLVMSRCKQSIKRGMQL